ncbi:MAG TPA: hypothetical protein VL262_08055 [Vicinamibacterales bacterium]|nr:hypothetical protein [Vicinamibacterales bacterium]
MKGTVFVVIAFAAAPAFAQTVSQDPVQSPVPPPPATAISAPHSEARQQQVRMMEGVIVAAVRNGAEGLARQLQVSEPGSLIVTGTARARGFALDGYGVFFDVDVPQMKQSVAWSTMMLLRDARRQQLQQVLASNADPDMKRRARADLQRLESSVGPIPIPPAGADASPVAQGAPGRVAAQNLADTPGVPVPVDQSDPNQLYTESIKSALIDAMLNYSGPMDLGPDEWLTIAARDSDGPLMPGAVDDASTIVLRVKGSDVAAFLAKKITPEEARKRVQVKEF